MSVAALLLDVPGVLDATAEPVFDRLALAQVPILLFAEESPALADHPGVVASIVPSGFPAPLGLLRACNEHGVDLATSWLVTMRDQALAAASVAGIPQAVWLGGDAPQKPPLIRIERARDLADAPRVMVPQDGGCWHGH